MNNFAVTLPKLEYDREGLIELFKEADFGIRWGERPTGKYRRANNPPDFFEHPCIKQIREQVPSDDFQFISIIANWEMAVHVDTGRPSVLMITLSDDPEPTHWFEEPEHIRQLRLHDTREKYIRASRKEKLEPIYTQYQDGTPTLINSYIPHNTSTMNGKERWTLQIGIIPEMKGETPESCGISFQDCVAMVSHLL